MSNLISKVFKKNNKNETRKTQMDAIYGLNKEFTQLQTGCLSNSDPTKGWCSFI